MSESIATPPTSDAEPTNYLHRITRCLTVGLAGLTDRPDHYATLVRPTGDPRHGDYQINAAMSLAATIRDADGRPADRRDVAAQIVDACDFDAFCSSVEIAGPGFINLTIDDEHLVGRLEHTWRSGQIVRHPKQRGDQDTQTVVLDFSSPNVAKPMHVGHIRSTVIGDALAKTFRHLGHRVITDNHLGDWGTQFGMIIYGYKHFGDDAKIQSDPVGELLKLYRKVQSIATYHKDVKRLSDFPNHIARAHAEAVSASARCDEAETGGESNKKLKKLRKSADSAAAAHAAMVQSQSDLRQSIENRRQNASFVAETEAHADIASAVLEETAKLHRGDPDNLALWNRFLPHSQDEINRIYDHLDIQFDHTLGESFYHDRLAGIVDQLFEQNLATRSDGAACVFIDGFDAPMIVQKSDGAFLYATTDLATLRYRLDTFEPDQILYVVDSRQGDHFRQLFAVAESLGWNDAKLVHVNFGTVLDKDGKPMKTRDGDLITLESLLMDAITAAKAEVCDDERLSRFDPPMDETEQRTISRVVGIGAVKFADLSHERTSDYRFDVEKMVDLQGDTSTYIQYQYTRTQSIQRRAGFDRTKIEAAIAQNTPKIIDSHERMLALAILRMEESLDAVAESYAPNLLAAYALSLSRAYSRFNEQCPVIKAPDEVTRVTRLMLVSAAGDAMQTALGLMGIKTVPRM